MLLWFIKKHKKYTLPRKNGQIAPCGVIKLQLYRKCGQDYTLLAKAAPISLPNTNAILLFVQF